MPRRLLILAVLMCLSVPVLFAQRATVSGSVIYRERIALPPTASLEVTLEDVSRADATGVIVARMTIDAPGQVPIPFDLPYDAGRIESGHRYSLRAQILNGRRLLFTTTEAALVITQGHSSRVSLVLRSTPEGRMTPPTISSAPVPPAAGTAAAGAASAPLRPLAPLPPPVELRNLPATFTGTLPCADCTGMKYELNLFADDSFFLRTTYLGKPAPATQDVIGSWVLSSDRRVVVLHTGRDVESFSIRDGFTLRKLDMSGQPIESRQSYDLRRAAGFEPIDARASVRGVYVQTADAARFVECSTGQTWIVTNTGSADAMKAAYASAGRKAGEPLLVSAQVHLDAPRASEPTVTIEALGQTLASETCAPRFAAAPFDGTTWSLRRLGGTAVAASPAGTRNEPSLTFRGDTGAFSGTGGCNRLVGQFQTRGEALLMMASGTMMSCSAGADSHEAAFTSALAGTRSYRILGRTLELYGERRQMLARFEAK